MTDFNLQIAADNDDVQSYGSTFDANAQAHQFGAWAGVIDCALRFDNITIPKDANIISAVVRMRSDTNRALTTCNANIYIENSDDPAIITSESDFNGRAVGSPVAWSSIPSWTAGNYYDSEDFGSILETHLSRSGWASGQSLIVFLKNNGSTDLAVRTFRAHDYSDGSDAAELRIVYNTDVEGEVEDALTIDDSVDAFSLTDIIPETFTVDDQVSASGGSTEVSLADDLTISDLVSGNFEIQAVVPDGLTISDLVDADAEINVDLSDDFTISDGADCFLWSEWLRENYGKYLIRLYATLTGEADGESDLDLAFTSFQSTKRNGDATYLSLIVPGLGYSSAVSARANGDLRIEMAYIVNGVEDFRENIIEVDLEGIRIDEGARRGSITLSGSRVVEYGSNLVTLEKPIYKYVSEGKIRYRFLYPDPWLNPGDVVRCRTDEFVVQYITYTISDRFKQMEVSEV